MAVRVSTPPYYTAGLPSIPAVRQREKIGRDRKILVVIVLTQGTRFSALSHLKMSKRFMLNMLKPTRHADKHQPALVLQLLEIVVQEYTDILNVFSSIRRLRNVQMNGHFKLNKYFMKLTNLSDDNKM